MGYLSYKLNQTQSLNFGENEFTKIGFKGLKTSLKTQYIDLKPEFKVQ